MDAVQSVTQVPPILDTTNAKALEAGLRISRNRIIINGFYLEPAKLEHILPLAKQFDTDIIGYLLYPNSHVPADALERMEIALELFNEI